MCKGYIFFIRFVANTIWFCLNKILTKLILIPNNRLKCSGICRFQYINFAFLNLELRRLLTRPFNFPTKAKMKAIKMPVVCCKSSGGNLPSPISREAELKKRVAELKNRVTENTQSQQHQQIVMSPSKKVFICSTNNVIPSAQMMKLSQESSPGNKTRVDQPPQGLLPELLAKKVIAAAESSSSSKKPTQFDVLQPSNSSKVDMLPPPPPRSPSFSKIEVLPPRSSTISQIEVLPPPHTPRYSRKFSRKEPDYDKDEFYRCKMCKRVIVGPNSENEYAEHIKSCINVTSFECSICFKKFAHKRGLTNHLRITHLVFD